MVGILFLARHSLVAPQLLILPCRRLVPFLPFSAKSKMPENQNSHVFSSLCIFICIQHLNPSLIPTYILLFKGIFTLVSQGPKEHRHLRRTLVQSFLTLRGQSLDRNRNRGPFPIASAFPSLPPPPEQIPRIPHSQPTHILYLSLPYGLALLNKSLSYQETEGANCDEDSFATGRVQHAAPTSLPSILHTVPCHYCPSC